MSEYRRRKGKQHTDKDLLFTVAGYIVLGLNYENILRELMTKELRVSKSFAKKEKIMPFQGMDHFDQFFLSFSIPLSEKHSDYLA